MMSSTTSTVFELPCGTVQELIEDDATCANADIVKDADLENVCATATKVCADDTCKNPPVSVDLLPVVGPAPALVCLPAG